MSEGKDNEESIHRLQAQNLETEANLRMELEADTENQ